ncbi:hypothetical protein DNU06_13280 [Putridiphycobacter roseus]|uniref:AB hydrolase-1 domain-containing protein n=1 Tax=Putridiphycobacter roseus TaxID=2219161 RepID=A0A2W1MYJ0_9FLAO|nr:alpha/beta hydrolase [Putridiphycobacter roseus]PZE16280.1 hypothetical protein DNU06_13280 [Putridiphycobacter roseus]
MVKTVLVNDVDYRYTVSGKGPLMVFIHGFLETSQIWEDISLSFEDDYKVLKIDLPGHGVNSHLLDFFSIQQMASLVLEILKVEKNSPPIVIGHSMGGYVGLEIAQLIPIHLILLHSNFWEDSPQKKLDRQRLVEVVENNKKSFIQRAIPNLFAKSNVQNHWVAIENIKAMALRIDKAVIQNCTRAMLERNDFSAQAKHANWQVIQGDLDPIVTTSRMAEYLRGTELNCYTISNCGHMGFIEQPKELTEVLMHTIKDRS